MDFSEEGELDDWISDDKEFKEVYRYCENCEIVCTEEKAVVKIFNLGYSEKLKEVIVFYKTECPKCGDLMGIHTEKILED